MMKVLIPVINFIFFNVCFASDNLDVKDASLIIDENKNCFQFRMINYSFLKMYYRTLILVIYQKKIYTYVRIFKI